jgi:hypothetical protein
MSRLDNAAMTATVWGATPNPDQTGDIAAESHKVELIGTQLRAAGTLIVSGRQRLSDYVNAVEGFFRIEDVMLRARNGDATRIVLPEIRVRLDEITLIGQARQKGGAADGGNRRIQKVSQRLVVMTKAHEIYGYAHIHEMSSVEEYVDAEYPRFIPMTNVNVRWLADRRLAGRFDLALLQRSHIIGVATVTGGRGRGRGRETAADPGTTLG